MSPGSSSRRLLAAGGTAGAENVQWNAVKAAVAWGLGPAPLGPPGRLTSLFCPSSPPLPSFRARALLPCTWRASGQRCPCVGTLRGAAQGTRGNWALMTSGVSRTPQRPSEMEGLQHSALGGTPCSSPRAPCCPGGIPEIPPGGAAPGTSGCGRRATSWKRPHVPALLARGSIWTPRPWVRIRGRRGACRAPKIGSQPFGEPESLDY